MFLSDDPALDFERHDREQEKWRLSRPQCDICGEHIQDDHCYKIEGTVVCPDCLEMHYREEIESD
jgi:formylmethanofuran dehydrogenase subunit E